MMTLADPKNDSAAAAVALLEQQLRAFEAETSQDEQRKEADSIDWRMAIDTSNDAFLAVDAAGAILVWSDRAEQLFGWTAAEAVGKQLEETIFPNDATGAAPSGLQRLSTFSDAGERREAHARCKNGDDLPVEVSMSTMLCGSSFIFNAFIHDISQRKQLQVQLAHSQKLESIGQLSAGIAHEINTPTQYVGDNIRFFRDALDEVLGVLDAYAKLAEAVGQGGDAGQALAAVQAAVDEADLDYLTGELSDAVDQSLEGVERVASIVRAMKGFSHPGSASKTPTDLNAAIANTITVATNEWKYVATVETDFDAELPLTPCLPGDFNQVILNIIVNAAHAIRDKMPEGEKGRIRVSTARDGESAVIRIRDNGPGVPEKIIHKIFDPFFTTKDVGLGTGQGLAISRSVIVDKHRGTLDVESVDGEGATFTIRLPLAADPAAGA